MKKRRILAVLMIVALAVASFSGCGKKKEKEEPKKETKQVVQEEEEPEEVEEEMIRALHTMGNPGRGAHDATLQAGRCVYQVREQLAQLFKAESADCIAFTSNATEALNTAILGLFQKGDHVITTVCEHNSVLRPLYRLQKQGVEVSFLSADEQ